MLGEVKLGDRYLGSQKMLKNATAFKQARSLTRGYMTTICYWTLIRVGWLDALEQARQVATDAFCASNGFDREVLGNVLRYLPRRGHLEEQSGALRFAKQGSEHWPAVTSTFAIFSAYQHFFENLETLVRGEVARRDSR